MTAPDWKDRAEFEQWWKAHGAEFRALSVKDPPAWERIAQKIEAFQVAHRGY